MVEFENGGEDFGPGPEPGPEPAPRRRGRPSTRAASPIEIDPAKLERKRAAQRAASARWQARKRAAASGAAEEKEPLSLGSAAREGIASNIKAAPIDENSAKQIAEMLLMMHTMAATALGVQEFLIQPSEAEMLGTATASVARHYKWGGLAEKTKDWLMFAGAVSIVYGPRFRAIAARRKAARHGLSPDQVREAPEPPLQ